jgi:carbon storage regulator CsrA
MPLSLTRKVGQSIHIGDDIKVEVVEVTRCNGENPRVMLSIDAPESMSIIHGEVIEKCRQEMNGECLAAAEGAAMGES